MSLRKEEAEEEAKGAGTGKMAGAGARTEKRKKGRVCQSQCEDVVFWIEQQCEAEELE